MRVFIPVAAAWALRVIPPTEFQPWFEKVNLERSMCPMGASLRVCTHLCICVTAARSEPTYFACWVLHLCADSSAKGHRTPLFEPTAGHAHRRTRPPPGAPTSMPLHTRTPTPAQPSVATAAHPNPPASQGLLQMPPRSQAPWASG